MFKYPLLRTLQVASPPRPLVQALLVPRSYPVKPIPSLLSRQFSNTSPAMTTKLSYEDAVLNRRTIYQLTKKAPQSDERIKEIINNVVTHSPSSFNSQSTRVVVLLGKEHDKFWDATTEILKAIVPEAQWEHTAQRMAGFKGAYGSALFYEDPAVVRGLQEKFPPYADKFPQWSEHTSAIHQFNLWVALEAEGFGANLQHYNPLVNSKASEIWNVPQDWNLTAQLVFGGLAEGARDNLPKKDVVPLEKRVFFHAS